jgi:hypothetical protein
MDAVVPEIDPRSSPPTGSKARLCTLESLDGRTRAAQRAHELVKALQADLGGSLSARDLLAVRRAAMLAALAEDATARQLTGDATDIDQLVRLNNASRRAILDLGKNIRGGAPSRQSLSEYLKARKLAGPAGKRGGTKA